MDKMIYNCSFIPYELIGNNNPGNESNGHLPLTTIANRNVSISYMFGRISLIFKLIYKIKKETIIKLLGNDFFNRNKRKIQIIINNKLMRLKDNYINLKNENKILKVKLMILTNKKINLSKMFYNCISLKECSLISQNGKNYKSEIKEEQNSFYYKNIDDDSLEEEENISKFFRDISNRKNYDEISDEKRTQSFNKRHDSFYPSFSFDINELKNNSNQFKSKNDSFFSSKSANKIIFDNKKNILLYMIYIISLKEMIL